MLGVSASPLLGRWKAKSIERDETMSNQLLPIFNIRCARLIAVGGLALGASMANADVVYQQDFENWTNEAGLWSSNTQASLGGPYSTVLGRFSSANVSLSVRATAANNGGYTGGNTSGPSNITVDQFDADRDRVPYPDSGGGGGSGGGFGGGTPDGPALDLGGAIQDGNNGPAMFGAGMYSLSFDLMLFDSWDGNSARNGIDSIGVSVNGEQLFDEKLYSSAYGSGKNFRDPDETPSANAYNAQWIDSIYRNITLEFELSEERESLSMNFIGSLSQSIIDESWGIDNVQIEMLTVQQASVSVPDVPTPGTLVLLGSGFGMMLRRKR
jgi:hypothetical protein